MGYLRFQEYAGMWNESLYGNSVRHLARGKRSILWRTISSKYGVLPASFGQLWGHRYIAVFPKFAVPYGQYTVVQIYIPHGEAKRL